MNNIDTAKYMALPTILSLMVAALAWDGSVSIGSLYFLVFLFGSLTFQEVLRIREMLEEAGE